MGKEIEKKGTNFNFFVKLKNPEIYFDKMGTEKTIDTYYVSKISKSELLDNSLELEIEREDGSVRKITISRDEIKSIEEKS